MHCVFVSDRHLQMYVCTMCSRIHTVHIIFCIVLIIQYMYVSMYVCTWVPSCVYLGVCSVYNTYVHTYVCVY